MIKECICVLRQWNSNKQADADQMRKRHIRRLNNLGSARPVFGIWINASTHPANSVDKKKQTKWKIILYTFF